MQAIEATPAAIQAIRNMANPTRNLMPPAPQSCSIPSPASESPAATTFLCQITGGSTAAGYTVDIYGNGKGQAATGSGTLYVLDLAITSDLTAGEWVIGHTIAMTITGGSSE